MPITHLFFSIPHWPEPIEPVESFRVGEWVKLSKRWEDSHAEYEKKFPPKNTAEHNAWLRGPHQILDVDSRPWGGGRFIEYAPYGAAWVAQYPHLQRDYPDLFSGPYALIYDGNERTTLELNELVHTEAPSCPCSSRDLITFGHKCGRLAPIDRR